MIHALVIRKNCIIDLIPDGGAHCFVAQSADSDIDASGYRILIPDPNPFLEISHHFVGQGRRIIQAQPFHGIVQRIHIHQISDLFLPVRKSHLRGFVCSILLFIIPRGDWSDGLYFRHRRHHIEVCGFGSRRLLRLLRGRFFPLRGGADSQPAGAIARQHNLPVNAVFLRIGVFAGGNHGAGFGLILSRRFHRPIRVHLPFRRTVFREEIRFLRFRSLPGSGGKISVPKFRPARGFVGRPRRNILPFVLRSHIQGHHLGRIQTK